MRGSASPTGADESNIYVLDGGNHCVQVFGPYGTYLRTVWKEGQGPGELTDPFGIFLDETDNLYVSDGRKVHRFNPSGKISIRRFKILNWDALKS